MGRNKKNTAGKPHKFVIDWKKTKGKRNKQTGKMEVVPVEYLTCVFNPGRLRKGEKYITQEKHLKDGSIEFVKVKVKKTTKAGKIYYKKVELEVGAPISVED